MQTQLQVLTDRQQAMSNATASTMDCGYGYSSHTEPKVTPSFSTGPPKFAAMAASLRNALAAGDCRHFKARDYHELELLLAMYNENNRLSDPTQDKKAIRFFDERELVDQANYIPKRDNVVVVTTKPPSYSGRPPKTGAPNKSRNRAICL
ncbi:hypothetical protein BpHYR1_033999 [Brachionus plicatilis]|uniref:Uncharacterized protein n=1 Tax=Brachionus plicatilis TaxID=10195 RepID=A0A3M7RCJ6_BRAPC|nr:hypothetical protein BpHYR1_033999 [Brachionus plicatilis]